MQITEQYQSIFHFYNTINQYIETFENRLQIKPTDEIYQTKQSHLREKHRFKKRKAEADCAKAKSDRFKQI